MSDDPNPPNSAAALADVLLLTSGVGVMSAGLITILASADAFAARLLGAHAHASDLSALQMRQLINTLAAEPGRVAAATATDIRTVEAAVRLPPGAPVVT